MVAEEDNGSEEGETLVTFFLFLPLCFFSLLNVDGV